MSESPPKPPARNPTLSRLRSRGFDRSTYNRAEHTWRVRCSQCEALVINGVPCHEPGCPNHTARRDRAHLNDD